MISRAIAQNSWRTSKPTMGRPINSKSLARRKLDPEKALRHSDGGFIIPSPRELREDMQKNLAEITGLR